MCFDEVTLESVDSKTSSNCFYIKRKIILRNIKNFTMIQKFLMRMDDGLLRFEG